VSFTAVADTSIYQDNPDGNLGSTTLLSGMNYKNSRGRALFVFYLSGIPANATISEAHVSLAVVERPDPDQHGGPIPSNFGLYRMLVSWGEGSGSAKAGSPARFGEATWTSRFYPLVTWDSPGGTAGVDYLDSPSSSTAVDDKNVVYVFQSTTALLEDVQTWVNTPETNFGYMLISDNEFTPGTGRRFASTESGLSVALPAPTLSVDYVVPEPSAGWLAGIALIGWACSSRSGRRQFSRRCRRVT
jgi:hypothetical protein